MKKLMMLLSAALCAVGAGAVTAAKDGIGYEYLSPGHVRIVSADPALTEATIRGYLDGCYVDSIAAEAFAKCSDLKRVNFFLVEGYPIRLEDDAFHGCTALSAVSFSLDDVVEFGNCFSGCKKLTSIVIPRYATFTDAVGFLRYSYLQDVTYMPDVYDIWLDRGFNEFNGLGDLADAGAAGKLRITSLTFPAGEANSYYVDDSKTSSSARRSWWKGITVNYAKYPRVWARNNSSVNGTMVFTVDGQTVANGSQVQPGKKVTVKCVGAKGEGVFSGLALVRNSVEEWFTKDTVTFTMSDSDISIKSLFVSLAEEREYLDMLGGDDSILPEPDATKGLSTVERDGETWYVGKVGAYLGMKLHNSEMLKTRTTFKLVGAPGGLKVRQLDDGSYALEGVPTKPLTLGEASTAPAYVVATGAGGSKVTFRLNLAVESEMDYTIHIDCVKSKTSTYSYFVSSWSKFKTVSPAVSGFTWDASTVTAKFKAPSVGNQTVKLTRKVTGYAGKYTEFRTIVYRVFGPVPSDADFKKIADVYPATVGKRYSLEVADWFKGDSSSAVSGLPPGLSFDASKKKISGKPTKAGRWFAKITKVAGGKTQTAYTLFEVEEGEGATITVNRTDTGLYWDGNVLAVLAGYKDKSAFSVSSSKAEVTVTGLPKGVSFKKDSDGIYKISSSRPTKTGDYVVTVKATLNGVTAVERYLYRVVASPLAGEYRGYVFTAIGAGTTKITVSKSGKAYLTMQEGSLKNSKIAAYPSSVSGWSFTYPDEGSYTYKFKLPASAAAKVGKRTVKVVLTSTDGGSRRYADSSRSSVGKDSNSKGSSTSFVANAIFEDYDAFRDALGYHHEAALCYRYAVFGTSWCSGCGFYATVSTADGKAATVKGRLPAGKSFTLTLPYLYRCEEDVAGFAPGAVIDNDGRVYVIQPTFDETHFSENGAASVLMSFKGDNWDYPLAGEYCYARGEARSNFLTLCGYIGRLTFEIGSKTTSLDTEFTSKSKVAIDGAKVSSCKYSSSTGLVTITFTKGGYTYTAYLLLTEYPGLDHYNGKYLHGVIKRVKDSKTTWGSVRFEGAAG